jgi:hypothetical protein
MALGAAFAVAALLLTPSPAAAQVRVGVFVGAPVVAAPVVVAPAPAVVAPVVPYYPYAYSPYYYPSAYAYPYWGGYYGLRIGYGRRYVARPYAYRGAVVRRHR